MWIFLFCFSLSLRHTLKQSVDKSTNTNTIATTSNGGTGHLVQANQNGSIATAIAPCPTQISITDAGCDKQPHLESTISVSGEHSELPVGSIVNEKHNQNASDRGDEINRQSDSSKMEIGHDGDGHDDDGTGEGDDAGNGSTGGNSNDSGSRQLNFLNLKLQCMCSDDDASVITKSNVDPLISKQMSVDDDTEIEISEVEAVTEIGESIFENHRSTCTHCGRGHCCFFLRCCYCIANGIDALNECGNNQINDVNRTTNSMAMHENNQWPSECVANRKANSNNIPLGSSSCTEIGSNQNLASKRCDEICKISRNQHGSGLCSGTATASASASVVLAKKQCCERVNIDNVDDDKHGCTPVTKSIAMGCHCRWYCIRDCDSDSKLMTLTTTTTKTKTGDERAKTESKLAVQEPEIVSPITSESPFMDETVQRCCRCSKELF